MDIAKYIGLYLLKNQYCYVHGLGNMELKKIRSTHDGSALQPPSYEVLVTPGGSIDDNLANFIATNEQISISKAANTLREYSIQARKDMAEGKEVAIPNIGRFIESDGKVKFVTDDNFKYTPASIPTIKNSKQLDEQNSRLSHKPSYPPPAKADSVNWSMVILVVVLIVILAGAGYFIYDYTTKNNAEEVAVPVTETIAPPPIVAPVADTVAPQVDTVDSAASVVVDTTMVNNYKIVIGNYRTKERAEKRVKNLSLNGNKVEMLQKDTASYLVIAPISCRVIDTIRVKDSLKRMFGFQDVMIYK
jgi:nucleoid DNA-binding protein/flagellar basal body-associated protein FliL